LRRIRGAAFTPALSQREKEYVLTAALSHPAREYVLTPPPAPAGTRLPEREGGERTVTNRGAAGRYLRARLMHRAPVPSEVGER